MYDDLISALREIANSKGGSNINMPMLLTEAADAIQELSKKYLASEVDNINLTGWLAEEHAKHLWIPVTERLPDVGKDVLCFCRANIYFVLGWDGYHWHEGADRYYMSRFVTHWMPLPEPPKEET